MLKIYMQYGTPGHDRMRAGAHRVMASSVTRLPCSLGALTTRLRLSMMRPPAACALHGCLLQYPCT